MPVGAPLSDQEVALVWQNKRQKYFIRTGQDILDVVKLHESTQILDDAAAGYERIHARPHSGGADFPSLKEHLESTIGAAPPEEYQSVFEDGMEIWVYLPALLLTTPYLFASCGYRARRALYEQMALEYDQILRSGGRYPDTIGVSSGLGATLPKLMDNLTITDGSAPDIAPPPPKEFTQRQLNAIWDFRRQEYYTLYGHHLEDGLGALEAAQKRKDAKDELAELHPDDSKDVSGFPSLADYLDLMKGTSPSSGFVSMESQGKEYWMLKVGSLVTTPYLFHSHEYRQRRSRHWSKAWRIGAQVVPLSR